MAALQGATEVVGMLRAAGAAPPELDPSEEFVAAVMRGDEAAARASTAGERVRRDRPGLVVWAAGQGRVEAVRLLLDLGFAIDALGRADVPVEGASETALRAAVSADVPDLVRLLLDRGADAGVRDKRFEATPADCAAHLGRPEIAALLEGWPGRRSPEL
ncbi:ankyrin repeat domain-containing protein [Pseudonocardia sediminis]|uniref:ankyrin repeat domain-containing protein n=1 Tax=Pseudonocardia sediminis TaxID=1397368 RepID=UPI001029624C|nr:ankyrin repeat domain-containing protein [Pseudonocardia sediminis]